MHRLNYFRINYFYLWTWKLFYLFHQINLEEILRSFFGPNVGPEKLRTRTFFTQLDSGNVPKLDEFPVIMEVRCNLNENVI